MWGHQLNLLRLILTGNVDGNNERGKLLMLDLTQYGYKTLNIETVGNCNMNCKFCNWDKRQNKQAVLDEEVIYSLIIEAVEKNSGCNSINFSQFNEPLIDKRLFDFISFTKQNGMQVVLTSNGLLLGKQNVLDGILSFPPDDLTLSVQTLNKKQFGYIRGINMDFTRYAEIIYGFLSAVRDTNTQVTIDIACNFLTHKKRFVRKVLGFNIGDPNVPLSLDDVYPDLFNFLEGLQSFDSNFSFDLMELKKYIGLIESNYQNQDSFELASNIRVKVKRFMYGHRLMEFEMTPSKFSCAHSILGVLASGDVVPCCHMSSPFVSLGNVSNQSISEILESSTELIRNIRSVEGKKPDICKRCFGEQTKRALKLIKLRQKFNFDLGFNLLKYG